MPERIAASGPKTQVDAQRPPTPRRRSRRQPEGPDGGSEEPLRYLSVPLSVTEVRRLFEMAQREETTTVQVLRRIIGDAVSSKSD